MSDNCKYEVDLVGYYFAVASVGYSFHAQTTASEKSK
jgi:hypothetical protein